MMGKTKIKIQGKEDVKDGGVGLEGKEEVAKEKNNGRRRRR